MPRMILSPAARDGDVVITMGAGGSIGGGAGQAAWFRFPPGDTEVARTRMRELLEWRVEKQPLQLPNAGSVFRNPPGDHAARLIEAAGLKGTRIGGAQVSEKHSNFIVNPEGSASASAIEMLIGRVQAEVREKFGISLQREVRIVGVAGQGGEGS
jgi:UDP-N-acetylmuramate dehydrogenase